MPGAFRARQPVKPHQSVPEEALAPLADDLAACVEPSGNLVVAQALGGQQDHLGSNDLEIGQRIPARPAAQFGRALTLVVQATGSERASVRLRLRRLRPDDAPGVLDTARSMDEPFSQQLVRDLDYVAS